MENTERVIVAGRCPCPHIAIHKPGQLRVDYRDGDGYLEINVPFCNNGDFPGTAQIVNIQGGEQRRVGSATQLWRCAENQLKRLGVQRVEGTVAKENAAGEGFWRKMGFDFSRLNYESVWHISKEI